MGTTPSTGIGIRVARTIAGNRRRVEIAQVNLEQFRERAAWADRMVKLKYMSPAQGEVERIRMLEAELGVLEARIQFRKLLAPKPNKWYQIGLIRSRR